METIDINRPEIQKAIDLASALVIHCETHNLPRSMTINGVAWSAQTIIDTERKKIADHLMGIIGRKKEV